jgi:glycosyltransferase involved in cell wall biosynthesis
LEEPRLWARAVSELLESADLRKAAGERALRRARQFSWEKTAQITAKTYQDVIRKP